ncbi:MAG: glycoside hydrolase family 16 protein [Bacillota bacterium]
MSANEVKAKGFSYDYEALTYELVFEDTFEGDTLNLENWGFDVGGSGWGNDELQYYTEGDNVRVENGQLFIELRKEDKEDKKYTSSRLVTRNKVDILYGKVEVRAKLPKGLGTWPAIWMLSTDWEYGKWPASGELDILEHVGYDQDVIHASIHTESYFFKINTQKQATIPFAGVSEEFHTYFIEWLPDVVHIGVDDTVYQTYRPTDYLENPTYKEWPFDKRMHLLMNIAYGGNWGGKMGIDESCLPQEMVIDFVRMYQSPQLKGLKQNT